MTPVDVVLAVLVTALLAAALLGLALLVYMLWTEVR